MGYACPVCGSPQADGEHLANHLAFAAMLHGDAHEAWLDERVPDWADRDPDGLAATVVEHAEETDHETAFEDTGGGRPDVDLGPDAHRQRRGSHRELDPEARRAVEEAIEMTRERRAGRGAEPEDQEEASEGSNEESEGVDREE